MKENCTLVFGKAIMLIIFLLSFLCDQCTKEVLNGEVIKGAGPIDDGDYYVAIWGNDNDPGTFEKPWATWQKAFETAKAGDIVYFRGGVYLPTSTSFGNNITMIAPKVVPGQYTGPIVGNPGTYENPVCFYNYPGESPVLDCSRVKSPGKYCVGIMLYWADFIRFRGLTIRNVYQRNSSIDRVSGINSWGCSNITYENMTVHNIGGAAIYSLGSNGKFGILFDTTRFINCDLYNLCDTFNVETPGNFGDGIKADNEKGAFFEFSGCRIWNFSDDGIDCGGPCVTIINNCWAFNGGIQKMGIDGNGFKFGGVRDSITVPSKIVTNCIAAYNAGSGFFDLEYYVSPGLYHRNNSRIYNNISYKNKFGFTGSENKSYPNYFPTRYRNNIAYQNVAPEINDLGTYHRYDENHNTWDQTPKNQAPFNIYTDTVMVSEDDFESIAPENLMAPRVNGKLPFIKFLRLRNDSDLKGAGTFVGMSKSPDIGIDWDYLNR